MKKMVRFEAVIEDGHKGAAVIVPFEPGEAWGAQAVPVPVWSDAYGKEMPGVLVEGKLEGVGFDGWIGKRWGKCFLLVDEALMKRAKVRVGQVVEVAVKPKPNPKPKAAGRSR